MGSLNFHNEPVGVFGVITFRNRRWTLLLRFAGVEADSILFPNARINFHIGKVDDLASSCSATDGRRSYLVVPDPIWVMWDLSGLQASGGMRCSRLPVTDSPVPLDIWTGHCRPAWPTLFHGCAGTAPPPMPFRPGRARDARGSLMRASGIPLHMDRAPRAGVAFRTGSAGMARIPHAGVVLPVPRACAASRTCKKGTPVAFRLSGVPCEV